MSTRKDVALKCLAPLEGQIDLRLFLELEGGAIKDDGLFRSITFRDVLVEELENGLVGTTGIVRGEIVDRYGITLACYDGCKGRRLTFPTGMVVEVMDVQSPEGAFSLIRTVITREAIREGLADPLDHR